MKIANANNTNESVSMNIFAVVVPGSIPPVQNVKPACPKSHNKHNPTPSNDDFIWISPSLDVFPCKNLLVSYDFRHLSGKGR